MEWELFSYEESEELADAYKKKQEPSVVTQLKENDGEIYVDIQVLDDSDVRLVVQQERVAIEFAPYDYQEFVNGKLFIRKKVVAEYLHQEINKRIYTRYYDEIQGIYRKREEERQLKEQHQKDRERILNKLRSEQVEVKKLTKISNTKYGTTGETKTLPNGVVLQRIQANKDFVLASGKNVYKGDVGGYIESEHNLAKTGNSWVGGNACVFGDAQVCEEAEVSGQAMVKDFAIIKGQATVFGHTVIENQAQVMGKASVYGSAKIQDQAKVGNRAIIKDRVRVMQSAQVGQYVQLGGDTRVLGNAVLVGDTIYEGSDVIS